MNYTKVDINTVDETMQEILIAQLAGLGYDGFEQNPGSLTAYTTEEHYNENALKDAIGDVAFSTESVPMQNWNAVWESNFEPVVVDNFCTVRADFHDMKVSTPYEIIITPKMSFGTGHHATTQLMMSQMRNMDMKDKQVLDFGTGTGVLAILAEKLGAGYILGIDNDEWSVENSKENIERNGCHHVSIVKNDTDHLPSIGADIILANINRHVLLQYMTELYENINDNGQLLLSGILAEDIPVITESATGNGFKPAGQQTLNNWAALLFEKKK